MTDRAKPNERDKLVAGKLYHELRAGECWSRDEELGIMDDAFAQYREEIERGERAHADRLAGALEDTYHLCGGLDICHTGPHETPECGECEHAGEAQAALQAHKERRGK